MKTKLKPLRLIPIGCFFILMAVVVMSAITLQRDAETLKHTSRDNVSWNAAQAELELRRLMSTIAAVSVGTEGFTPQEVQDRFDILWSRFDIFLKGSTGETLSSYEGVADTIHEAVAMLQANEEAVFTLKPGDVPLARALMSELRPFAGKLRDVGLNVVHGEAMRFGELRAKIRWGNMVTAVSTLAALITALGIAVQLYLDARANRRQAAKMLELVAAANAANEAKGHFLALMSHELRTPLNGILGLLALARGQSHNPEQTDILEDAEASGRQLTRLLGNVLEFSELEGVLGQADAVPFNPQRSFALAQNALARRGDNQRRRTELEVDGDVPARVVGDPIQLQHAVTNLLEALDTYGDGNPVAARLSYRDDNLGLDFTVAARADIDKQEQPFQALDRSNEQDLTEGSIGSIGLAVVKRIVQQMKGKIGYKIGPDRALKLWLSLPAAAAEKTRIARVSLDTSSAAIENLCGALVSSMETCELAGEPGGASDIILFEAQTSEMEGRTRALRAQNPGATLIALSRAGGPVNGLPTISLPIDAVEFQDVLETHIARHGLAQG